MTRTEINCRACGQFLFASKKLPNGEIEEEMPSLPLLFRVGGPLGLSQVLCPICGHVNDAGMKVSPGLAVSKIHGMARAKTDEWRIARIGTHIDLPSAPSVENLCPAVDAFRKNIERINGLGISIALTTGLTFLSCSKYIEMYQIEDSGLADFPRAMIDVNMSHARLYRTLTADLRNEAMKLGKAELKTWILYHREIQAGVEAIFSSQIVSLWTAIETLMGDLWEAAINVHSEGLGNLGGAKNRIAKLMSGRRPKSPPDVPPEMETDEGGKSVLLSDVRRITRGTYNLSGVLGTLLRENFTFTRLEKIREAYSRAFFKDSEAIDEALCNRAIDALSAARNVLVHSAGKADQDYIKHLKSVPLLPKLAPGESFPLTGDITQMLMSPAISASSKLVSSVDKWIATH